MRKLLFTLFSGSLVLLALLVGCQSNATGNPDAVQVVKDYYAALNEGQIDKAMTYVSDEASFINPTGTYVGKAAIQESLQGLATDGITFDLSGFEDDNGRIVYDYKVMQGDQVLDQGSGGLTIVRDGKIIFDGTVDTEPSG